MQVMAVPSLQTIRKKRQADNWPGQNFCLGFKRTGPRDGLELSWHAWIELGIKKDHSRFSNFQISNKKNIFYILACCKCEPHSAWLCCLCVFKNNSVFFFLLVSSSGLGFYSIWLPNVQILRRHIWLLTNLTLLRSSSNTQVTSGKPLNINRKLWSVAKKADCFKLSESYRITTRNFYFVI